MTLRKIDIGNRPRWVQTTQTMPELVYVPITDLRVDDAYQREILRRGWNQIEWIAQNFNWASFSPVLVSRIDNGLYALIDGQHRSHAAYMAGYDQVPALCVEATQVEQAMAFSSVNARVTKITPHSIFKAALVAGEAWAVDCDRVVSDAGCRLMRSNTSSGQKKPGQVFAVMLIKEMVINMEGDAVTAGLKGLLHSQTGQEPEVWTMQILKPWLKAIASNSCYLHVDLKTALDTHVDLYLLDERSRRQAKETRESKPPIFRRMICDALDQFRKEKHAA